MDKNDRAWLWFGAVVLMLFGFTLVMNSFQAGWFLCILGMTYILASISPIQQWIAKFTR